MYTKIECSFVFTSADWQKFTKLFSVLHEKLGIREFWGHADPSTSITGYNADHWHDTSNANIIGFGTALIRNAPSSWNKFGIKFFDKNMESSRFISIEIDCKKGIVDMAISLEKDREPIKIKDDLMGAFKVAQVLKENVSEITPSTKEFEQKFKILLSAPQAQKDFDSFSSKAKEENLPIGILFIDINNFKNLNSKYTESKIDKTILPEAQYIIKNITEFKGCAYRQGGDEFVIILPNYSAREIFAFAETLRDEFKTHCFEVNGEKEQVEISIGFAVWPRDGASYSEVLSVANKAKLEAKGKDGNISEGRQ